MKGKKWAAWVLCLALILAFGTEAGYGAETGKPGVYVEAGELADNTLTLTVSMEDVTFNGVQLALKYDTARLTYLESEPAADAQFLKVAAKALSGGTVETVAYVDPTAAGTDAEHYYTIDEKEALFEVSFTVKNTKLYRDTVKLGRTSANDTGIIIANKVAENETQGLKDASMVTIDLTAAGALNQNTPGGSSGGGGGGGGGGGSTTPDVKDEEKKPEFDDAQKGDAAGTGQKPELADVKDHWAGKSIAKLVDAGLVSGYEDGSFRPERSLSRSEFAIILCKLAKVAPSTEPSSFSDTADHWARGYAEAAYRQGFTGGVGDGLFAPDANITRQELLVMLVNYLEQTKGELTQEAELTFQDAASIEAWAVKPMKKAVAAGFISGYEDGTLLPGNSVTRAEMAAVLEKLL